MENWSIIGQVACGLALLALLWWKLSPIIQFKRRGIHVDGTISNWMMMKEGGKTYYYPMITYHTMEGTVQTYRAIERCEGRPLYPVGTKVKVTYDPKQRDKVRTTYPAI